MLLLYLLFVEEYFQQAKNEALCNMRKELLEKMLSDTVVTFTNQTDMLQAEREFRRAELSCKEAFLDGDGDGAM